MAIKNKVKSGFVLVAVLFLVSCASVEQGSGFARFHIYSLLSSAEYPGIDIRVDGVKVSAISKGEVATFQVPPGKTLFSLDFPTDIHGIMMNGEGNFERDRDYYFVISGVRESAFRHIPNTVSVSQVTEADWNLHGHEIYKKRMPSSSAMQDLRKEFLASLHAPLYYHLTRPVEDFYLPFDINRVYFEYVAKYFTMEDVSTHTQVILSEIMPARYPTLDEIEAKLGKPVMSRLDKNGINYLFYEAQGRSDIHDGIVVLLINPDARLQKLYLFDVKYLW